MYRTGINMASVQSALPPTKPAPNMVNNVLHVSKYHFCPQVWLQTSLVSLHDVCYSVSLHVLIAEQESSSLLYCSNSCTSLHFITLKSHTKTLKIRPYMFRSTLKPSSGGPWPYFDGLLNWNVDLDLL